LTRTLRALSRTTALPPARLVHLGLGAFHRAHQAWYTHEAADSQEWGITGFTGRSASLATELAAQDNLYHLVTRDNAGDRAELISSLLSSRPGSDGGAWAAAMAAPLTAAVTLTVTENAYRYRESDGLAVEFPDVATDLETFRRGGSDSFVSVPGRLVAGLAARRRSGGGPLAIVPCDNLSDNAGVARSVVTGFADRVDPALADWIRAHISFVATMVDRITPATTPDLRTAVTELTGLDDACPVVTEPFTEWVLCGDFPAGRPDWASAGARFVDDVAPFEQRKLRLLNGAHSLLAYAGSTLGCRTVADAIADERLRAWVQDWWRLASPTVPLPGPEIAAYQQALLGRFDNARIAHQLAQIAADGSEKIRVRVLPVVREQRLAGVDITAAERILAAWIAHLRGAGAAVPVRDPAAATLVPASGGEWPRAVAGVLRIVAPELADDSELVTSVAELGAELAG
jgi:fructuronate reductase